MRALVQRVSQASVMIDGKPYSRIEKGLLVLLGIKDSDSIEDVNYLAKKIAGLRVFPSQVSGFEHSLLDLKDHSLLVVSQFTLYGDARKGRRPSFSQAAAPETARPLYESFIKALCDLGVDTKSGQFGAMMEVSLINSGPVTILLDSNKEF